MGQFIVNWLCLSDKIPGRNKLSKVLFAIDSEREM